jgi:DNA-binding NarL/FixJ family response regulator
MSTDSSPIRILVVDDHQLIRVGIAMLLLPESDMKLVGEASNGREAIAKFRECLPDVTLIDLQMPEMNGLDATIAIRGEFPEARMIVLTTYAGDVQAQRVIKAGAQAYLLKGLLHRELLQTIRAVHAGSKVMAPEVATHASHPQPTEARLVGGVSAIHADRVGCVRGALKSVRSSNRSCRDQKLVLAMAATKPSTAP